MIYYEAEKMSDKDRKFIMFKLATLSDATEKTHKLFESDIREFLNKLPAEFNKFKADLQGFNTML